MDSSLYVVGVVNDSTMDTSNARPSSMFAPAFRYEYQSDSMHVYWYFSEFNVNKRKLFLSNWCTPRIINYNKTTKQMYQEWTPQQMNNRSTTRIFPVNTGDTIGFYRELWLRRFGVSLPVYDYYKCSEVLSYSVELVDSASGARIALMDTTQFDTTRTSRKPCIASWYPMYSRVRYVVPEGYASHPVFLRINTYVVGVHPQVMIRVDEHGQMRSTSFLSNPLVQQYCQNVQSNLDCTADNACELTVASNTSPPTITVTLSSAPTATNISVYSVAGATVWSGAVPLPSNLFTVSVPTSGLYLVIARSASNVVCTRKVIVP